MRSKRWPRVDSPEVEAAAEAGMRCAEEGGSFVNIARAVIDAYHETAVAERDELVTALYENPGPSCPVCGHDDWLEGIHANQCLLDRLREGSANA